MFLLDESCYSCECLKDKLEGPHGEASGREELQRACRPVSTVSTQCTEETNTKRKALPPREKGLWVHSQESQDSTPRKGQEKEIPCTQSDLPPKDKGQCGSRRSARTTAFGMCCLPLSMPPPFNLAQGTGLAPLGTMNKNKHPPEKSRAGA